MMRDPPGLPSTSNSLPSFTTIVGVIDESGRLPGAIAFASPCTRPNMFGVAGLRREVVHLVVEQEAGAGHDDAGAEAAVDRVGHRDRVAFGVDDGEMRRLGRFA